jgi:hypothetical protein
MPFRTGLRLQPVSAAAAAQQQQRLRPFQPCLQRVPWPSCRVRRLRVVGGLALLDAGLVEQAGNAVGRLGANAEPVAHAVFDQAHAVFGVLGEQRVVGAHLLQILAVAGRALLEATIL